MEQALSINFLSILENAKEHFFLEGSDKTRSDFWGETMGPNGLGKEQKENSRKKEKGGGDRYIHVKS